MIKGLVWIIILFVLAIAIAFGTSSYDSTVHFVFGDTQVSMNLNTLIVAVIGIWILLFLLAKLVSGISSIPEKMKKYNTKRHVKKGEKDLNDLGLAYFEGRYQKAQQIAGQILGNQQAKDKHALALIFAAHSAESAHDSIARDKYLMQLEKYTDRVQLSRYLLLANDALNRNDLERAKACIDTAEHIAPNLTETMKLDLRYAMQSGDMGLILKDIGRLNRNGAVSESEMVDYRHMGYMKLIRKVTKIKDLNKVAKRLTDEDKATSLSVEVAQKYQELGHHQKAIDWVKENYPLKRQNELLQVLVGSFGYLSVGQQSKLIDTMEEWLKLDPKNGALLQTMGELAYQNSLWGKAQSYLEAAINNKPTIAAHLTLAKVYDKMGKPEMAQDERERAIGIISVDDSEAEEEAAKGTTEIAVIDD